MKKKIAAIIITAIAVFIYSACKNPPIFAAIEQEVKLKPASVTSFVRGLVKVENKLYVSNGKILTKTIGETGKWTEVAGKGLCLFLATDGTYLYGLFKNESSVTGYRYENGQWTKLAGVDGMRYIGGTGTVFAITRGNDIYTMNGLQAISTGRQAEGTPKGAAGDYYLTDKSLYAKNGQPIAGSPAGGRAICGGPGNSVLIITEDTLYCYGGTGWSRVLHGVTSPQSLTYLEAKKLVLISGKDGFGEIQLNGGTDVSNMKHVPAGTVDSAVPLANYYQYKNSVGKWYLNPIHAFTHNEGYIIYTGVLDPNVRYAGLWGFYYPKQIEWNRE